MAHEGASSTRNGRTPAPSARREAVRRPAGQRRRIIVRQRRHPLPSRPRRRPGAASTLFALVEGKVDFGTRRGRRVVDVLPAEAPSA